MSPRPEFVLRRAPCNQSFFWDAADDEVYYYLQGAAILKHDMRTNKNSVLIDYSKQPEFHFHEIVRGGTGDTSKDNWISFWAPDEKTDLRRGPRPTSRPTARITPPRSANSSTAISISRSISKGVDRRPAASAT